MLKLIILIHFFLTLLLFITPKIYYYEIAMINQLPIGMILFYHGVPQMRDMTKM